MISPKAVLRDGVAAGGPLRDSLEDRRALAGVGEA